MFERLPRLVCLFRLDPAQSRTRKSRRCGLRLEALEARHCPSGTWSWLGPAGGDGLWSNPSGQNWNHNGALAPANQYPGVSGQTDDVVQFRVINATSATMDVPLISLRSLEITNWWGTLTVNFPMWVSGQTGDFLLTTSATIQLAAGSFLSLSDLGTATSNLWDEGLIAGGPNTQFNIIGSLLNVSDVPSGLGTIVSLKKSTTTGLTGVVQMSSMTTNLTLTGANTYIDAGDGGVLNLSQVIGAAGQQGTEGGIALGAGHTDTLAVQVEGGGLLERTGTPVAGVSDQVAIAGNVKNLGGTVQLSPSTMLNITGRDAFGYSYWQKVSANGLLYVMANANISATGTYQIDAGAVNLTAVTRGNADELDGAGLVFGNSNPTTLALLDATGSTPGTVTVQGPVTLAQNTTTRLNFSGANNAADLLSVHNGALTLNGGLSLHGYNGAKPTVALTFLNDLGGTPSILGAFASIRDDVGGTDTGQVVNNPLTGALEYQVTIR